jgi:hypothetical protein
LLGSWEVLGRTQTDPTADGVVRFEMRKTV